MSNKEKSATKSVVRLIGSAAIVAEALEVSRHAVQHWCRVDKIPAMYVHPICSLAKGKFTPNELRPDVFPK